MPLPLGRRLFVAVSLVTVLVGCRAGSDVAAPAPVAATPSTPGSATPSPIVDDESLGSSFRQLEKTFDATLGVFALDTGTGRSISFRADRRFAYASTFKALQAGVLLKQRSNQALDKIIRYRKADLQAYSPITDDHVGTGLSLRALLDASLRYSDNTAANLIFSELGGPKAVDAALARIGDTTTHVDRTEPGLNSAVPGDVGDTSTPRAMAADLRQFVLGSALDSSDRTLLTDLLRRNTTGDKLIRASVPDGWVVGDKTGSGSYGTRNDIAVLWPPTGSPIVVAIMSTRDAQDADYDDALIARAAEIVVARLT